MRRSSSDLKALSREALNGQWGLPVAAYLLIFICSIILTLVITALLSPYSVLSIVTCQIMIYIVNLFVSLLQAGNMKMHLNINRKEAFELKDLILPFTMQPDRFLTVNLILLLAETGFRIGELLGVDYVRDIDYEAHLIKVDFRDGNENRARAKNAEYRYAKISSDTFEFLLYYLSEYRKLLQKQSYLFITIAGETAGRPLNVDAVYDMLERMEKKTGIKAAPHMLRRYFGNERWKNGWPLEMISHAYGHKHLDTTIKYLNIIDDSLIEASDRYYEKNSSMYDISKLL